MLTPARNCVLTIQLLASAFCTSYAQQQYALPEHELVHVIPKEWVIVSDLCQSPDGEHFVYKVRGERGEFLVLNGQKQKEYPKLGPFLFSAQGTRLAYMARKEEKWMVVVDGEELKVESVQPSAGVAPQRYLAFSQNEKSFACVARDDEKSLVILDGKEQPSYGEATFPVFSPDGGRFAYVAKQGRESFIVLDGEQQQGHASVRCPTFGAGGERFAYVAREGGEEFVVLDGEVQTRYQCVGFLTLEQAGRGFAYVAKQGDREFVVCNGREQRESGWTVIPTLCHVSVESVAFSEGLGRFAYVREAEVFLDHESLQYT